MIVTTADVIPGQQYKFWVLFEAISLPRKTSAVTLWPA